MFIKHLCPTYENRLKICVHPPILQKNASNPYFKMEATVVLWHSIQMHTVLLCCYFYCGYMYWHMEYQHCKMVNVRVLWSGASLKHKVPIWSLVNRVNSHMDRTTDQCFIIAKDTWTTLNLREVNFCSERNNFFKYIQKYVWPQQKNHDRWIDRQMGGQRERQQTKWV